MSRRAEALPVSFTAKERELIRHEMGLHFGQYPKCPSGDFASHLSRLLILGIPA